MLQSSWLTRAAGLAILIGSSAAAQTAPGPTPTASAASSGAAVPPPPFKPDRTAENYSYLGDPARRGDWADGFKFIPLDAEGNSYLSLGGEVRERAEIMHGPAFGLTAAGDDTYLLQRILFHADLHLGQSVRIFAQLGAHEAIGKRRLGPPDEDKLDIHQLFIDVTPDKRLRIRLGRQEMAFNPTQRFVSFRDGTNVRQNFDAGRLTYEHEGLRLEAFLSRPVSIERGFFENKPNKDQLFAGIYASRAIGVKKSMSFDAYWFLLERENLLVGNRTGKEHRHSLGLRFAGTSGRWDWDHEAVLQLGRSVGREIGAWAGSADLGYTFSSPVKSRLGLRLDAGSGDSSRSDHHYGSFHPLFPKGPYFNEANVTSWTNLLAIRTSLKLEPARRLTVEGAVQFKWRESRDDAVYLGPMTSLAATTGNEKREIGQVYSLDATFQLNRNLTLRAYGLHHSDGRAIRQAGGQSIDFLMGSATFRF